MKLTGLDSKEIPRYTYDEDKNANRVTIVDVGIADAIKEQLKDLKFEIQAPQVQAMPFSSEPIIIRETQIQRIEVPVIVKEIEYREIPVPVIHTEVKIVEIEKPVIQKEIITQTVEVPIVVKEIQTVYVDKLNYKLLFILQALTFGLIILSKFIK